MPQKAFFCAGNISIEISETCLDKIYNATL